jgi:hypothetical protein
VTASTLLIDLHLPPGLYIYPDHMSDVSAGHAACPAEAGDGLHCRNIVARDGSVRDALAVVFFVTSCADTWGCGLHRVWSSLQVARDEQRVMCNVMHHALHDFASQPPTCLNGKEKRPPSWAKSRFSSSAFPHATSATAPSSAAPPPAFPRWLPLLPSAARAALSCWA